MTWTGGIQPQNISPDAEDRFQSSKLTRDGHNAYPVGGCVHDLLIKLVPKDFDVVSNSLT